MRNISYRKEAAKRKLRVEVDDYLNHTVYNARVIAFVLTANFPSLVLIF